jgi:hypothetical protein
MTATAWLVSTPLNYYGQGANPLPYFRCMAKRRMNGS